MSDCVFCVSDYPSCSGVVRGSVWSSGITGRRRFTVSGQVGPIGRIVPEAAGAELCIGNVFATVPGESIYLFTYFRQFHEYWAKRYEMQITINIMSVWMLIRGCKAERTVKPVNTTLIYMEIKTNTPREYQSLFYSLKVNTRFKENSYFMHWSEGFKIFVHSETFQEEP